MFIFTRIEMAHDLLTGQDKEKQEVGLHVSGFC